jgi:Galactose oxidase, central domain
MYVFGGKDNDNNKLNDLWKLDLITYKWQIIIPADKCRPRERSGHSCDIIENYMVIFGGIYEITKELNDLHLYDFRKNKWITVCEESHSPVRGSSPYGNEETSPYDKGGMSPTKKGLSVSPLQKRGTSPPKTQSKSHSKANQSSLKIKKALNLNSSIQSGANAQVSRNSKQTYNLGSGI